MEKFTVREIINFGNKKAIKTFLYESSEQNFGGRAIFTTGFSNFDFDSMRNSHATLAWN